LGLNPKGFEFGHGLRSRFDIAVAAHCNSGTRARKPMRYAPSNSTGSAGYKCNPAREIKIRHGLRLQKLKNELFAQVGWFTKHRDVAILNTVRYAS
jgi:hypothetical protein